MPLNLDFLWLSLTMMKGLPYSSVAYTAELGSMDIGVKAFEVTIGPKVQLRVCHGSQPDKFEKIVANRQSHVQRLFAWKELLRGESCGAGLL